MARIGAGAPPFARRRFRLAQQAQVVRAFADPVPQPRPFAKQRLVRDLDDGFAFRTPVGHQQPRLGKGIDQFGGFR